MGQPRENDARDRTTIGTRAQGRAGDRSGSASTYAVASAFSIRQRGTEVSVESHVPGGWPFSPRYVLLDIIRISQMLNIPLAWPEPDPIVMDFEKGVETELLPVFHQQVLDIVERNTQHSLRCLNRLEGEPFVEHRSNDDLIVDPTELQLFVRRHVGRARTRAGAR